jgi:adenylate kinase family enzyme
VVGSAGSGKTTVAAALARNLGVPHIELDGIFHQPEWTPLEPDEFRTRVRQRTDGPAWVVDGNYSVVRDAIWERADTVLWLDLALPIVAARVVTRTVRRAVGRTELWNGNREPMSNLLSLRPERSIIAWSLSRHAHYRRRYTEAAADTRWAHLTFIRLKSRKEVSTFLRNVSPASLEQGVA